MYAAAQAEQDLKDELFRRDLERNESVIKGAAVRNARSVDVYGGSDPSRMRRTLADRGFKVEVTFGGIGTKVSF